MLDRLIGFIPGAVKMGIPLLYGCTGEILTEKSGNLNMGIPGIMYIGSISGVIGSFLYEKSLDNPADINPFLAVFIPLATYGYYTLRRGECTLCPIKTA